MITKVILTIALAFTFSGSAASFGIGEEFTPDYAAKSMMVKAINYNGEVIPMVELPEVVITPNGGHAKSVDFETVKTTNVVKQVNTATKVPCKKF